MKQLGFRMDLETVKKMYAMLAMEDLKFQEYVVNLIKNDMKEKGIK